MKSVILALLAMSVLTTSAFAFDPGPPETIKTGPYQTCGNTGTCPKDPPMRPHVPTVPVVRH